MPFRYLDKNITRTCGDDPVTFAVIIRPIAYYPHMRGWSLIMFIAKCVGGILPAHAGMIPSAMSLTVPADNITRTCGDDPQMALIFFLSTLYYPHMRGWSHQSAYHCFLAAILPAHAGMILKARKKTIVIEYITRTCGDDPCSPKIWMDSILYYPHMRGWSWVTTDWQVTQIILPAHAGMILR